MNNVYDPRVGEIYENPKGTQYKILEITNLNEIRYRIIKCGRKMDQAYLGMEAMIDIHDMKFWEWKIIRNVDKGIDNGSQ